MIDKIFKAIYCILPLFPIGFLMMSLTAYLIIKNHFGYIPCNDCIYEQDPRFSLNIPYWVFNPLFIGSMIGAAFVYLPVVALHFLLSKLNVLKSPIPWKLIIFCGFIYVLTWLLMHTDVFGWYFEYMLD